MNRAQRRALGPQAIAKQRRLDDARKAIAGADHFEVAIDGPRAILHTTRADFETRTITYDSHRLPAEDAIRILAEAGE